MNQNTSVIICTISIVIAVAATFVNMNKKIKLSAALLCASLIIMLVGISINTQSTIKSMRVSYDKIINEMELEIAQLKEPKEEPVEDFYHEEAELVHQAKNDDETYRTSFAAHSSGYVYVINSDKEYEDVPYLLTMKSNGTTDLKDDEIVVVWRCVN